MSNKFLFLNDLYEKQRNLMLEKKFLEEQVEVMQRQLNCLEVELSHLTRNLNTAPKRRDPLEVKKEINLDNASLVNEQKVTLSPTTSLAQMYRGQYFQDEDDSDEDM